MLTVCQGLFHNAQRGWRHRLFNYNSLQVVAEKRFTQGYQSLAHYTWSKALGYDSGYYAIDPRLNFGVTRKQGTCKREDASEAGARIAREAMEQK